MPKICGIYRITSPSGSFYIGSSMHVRARWSQHKRELRNGTHHNKPLQRAAEKYGVDTFVFELMSECDRATLRDVEQVALDLHKPEYNSSKSTFEALSGLWKNPEFREAGRSRAAEQMRELHKNPEFQAKQRAAASKALSESHKKPEFKKQHTERIKKQAAAINSNPVLLAKAIANRNTTYANNDKLREDRIESGRRLASLVHDNPALNERMREVNRAVMKAKRADPEARKRNLEAVLKRHCKPVLCVETNITYPSATAAEIALRSNSKGHVSSVARGERKKALGYTWRYL